MKVPAPGSKDARYSLGSDGVAVQQRVQSSNQVTVRTNLMAFTSQ